MGFILRGAFDKSEHFEGLAKVKSDVFGFVFMCNKPMVLDLLCKGDWLSAIIKISSLLHIPAQKHEEASYSCS